MKVKFIVPFPFDEKGIANRRAQLPGEFIRPGFQVEFVPVRNSCARGDSYYDAALLDMFVFEAGIRAEEEGYDAVCLDTVSDSAMYGLRSRLRIPVIGPGQASFHVASLLGHKFSIISMWDKWFHFYKKTLTEYGFWNKVASIRAINEPPDVENLFEGKEKEIFARLEAESRKAIEEDDADVIVLGSTTMHQAHRYLSERLPVPVINPGLVAYKLCEMLLELGLSHSKKAFASPGVIKDEDIFTRLASATPR